MTRHDSGPALALLVPAFVLYGRHLGDGYLADDFAYLASLHDGFDVLLRKVTVLSHPQSFRPLPAMAWCLAFLPAATTLHHGLSILLHAVAGWLVCRIATRTSRSRVAGLLLGALFVGFPLFAEPVVWLSAQPDLWACVAALTALDLAMSRPCSTPARVGGWTTLAVPGCFAFSLLCKESALFLPVLLFFFLPARRGGRLASALGILALLYLGLRFLVFGGFGGYLDSAGQSVIQHFDPSDFLHQLCRLPAIVLGHALKRAGALEGALSVTSGVLLGGLILSGRFWRRWRAIVSMIAVLIVALLPVAPIYFIGFDHEGSRMLYFPVAVAIAAGGGLLRAAPRSARCWGIAVLIFWGLIAVANGRSWSEASREIERTVDRLVEVQDRLPSGSVVLVAGHDTWHGAYTWRNALRGIVKLRGLRSDVDWRLGTAALIARPQELGRHIFEIGDSAGRTVDWTPCQAALHSSRQAPLAVRELRWPPDRDVEDLHLSSLRRCIAVRLIAARAISTPIRGQLLWRYRDIRQFNSTEMRRFQIFAGRRAQSSIVRLPPMTEPLETLDLRISLSEVGDFDHLERVEILEGPEICLAPED